MSHAPLTNRPESDDDVAAQAAARHTP
ncbi:MAG: hypothetical protein Q605_AUC00144G0002, partial [Actinomyces urogenitalis DORA_12]